MYLAVLFLLLDVFFLNVCHHMHQHASNTCSVHWLRQHMFHNPRSFLCEMLIQRAKLLPGWVRKLWFWLWWKQKGLSSGWVISNHYWTLDLCFYGTKSHPLHTWFWSVWFKHDCPLDRTASSVLDLCCVTSMVKSKAQTFADNHLLQVFFGSPKCWSLEVQNLVMCWYLPCLVLALPSFQESKQETRNCVSPVVTHHSINAD